MDLNSTPFPADFPWAMGPIGPVEDDAIMQFSHWLSDGKHGEMGYLDRYHEVRNNPELLLPGARSIVCVAFPYFTSEPIGLPISLYARGHDYHQVVREQLAALAAQLPPGETRLCVDTAPLRERYWAARLGLGFIGRNNQLIIPGLGSYFFLGFILTEAVLPAARWHELPPARCGECRRCIEACPGQCIPTDGSAIDARRCLSYLTIEYRGQLPEPIPTLYGCDVCQRVCPHNSEALATPIADFHPSETLQALTLDDIKSMTAEKFSSTFRHSAIKRTKLSGLLRNAAAFEAHSSRKNAGMGRKVAENFVTLHHGKENR